MRYNGKFKLRRFDILSISYRCVKTRSTLYATVGYDVAVKSPKFPCSCSCWFLLSAMDEVMYLHYARVKGETTKASTKAVDSRCAHTHTCRPRSDDIPVDSSFGDTGD